MHPGRHAFDATAGALFGQTMKLKRSRQQSSRSQTAFALAEVMVAVLVIAVAVISLYGAFFSGFFIVAMERENLRATQIMTRKTESIRLCTWGQLTNSNFSFREYYDPVGAITNASGILYCGTLSNRSAAGVL